MSWISDLPFLQRGAAIGLANAAPVGPIGVLSIQRTLPEGRIAGLVAGLRAATADAAHGAIAALGLAFISEFLIGRQPLVHTIGGGFPIYLGIKTFVSKLSEEPAPKGNRGLLGGLRLHVCTYPDQSDNHHLLCGNLCRPGRRNDR